MPFATGAAARCPDGISRSGGQCRWPGIRNAAGVIEYGCVNRKDGVGATAFGNIDGRVYNLIARNRYGTMKTVTRVSPSGPSPNNHVETHVNVTAALYRLHQTRVIAGGTGTGCQHPDATHQISCLVAASPCSIGLSSLPGDSDSTKPLAMRTPLTGSGYVLPTAENVRRVNDPSGTGCAAAGDFDLRYPLSRTLYLNAPKGFGSNNLPNAGLGRRMREPDPQLRVDRTRQRDRGRARLLIAIRSFVGASG